MTILVIFLITTLVSKMACQLYLHNEMLSNAEELREIMMDPDFLQKYRIIEADLDQKSLEAYKMNHIPTAIYFDASYNSTGINKYIVYDIPNENLFRSYVSSLGLSNSHHIIIYDRSPNGFVAAARAWFLFKIFGMDRVSILNGGYNYYASLDYSLTNKVVRYPMTSFNTNFKPDLIKNFYQILQIVEDKSEVLIDARERSEYEQGHIPTAINIPLSSLFDPQTKLLKTKDQLLQMMEANNINPYQSIVVYCLKGLRGSALKFTLDYLNFDYVSLYLGSWNEYSQRIKMI